MVSSIGGWLLEPRRREQLAGARDGWERAEETEGTRMRIRRRRAAPPETRAAAREALRCWRSRADDRSRSDARAGSGARADPPRRFGWQEGYGAFTVSESSAAKVCRYIHKQEEPHRQRTFEGEWVDLLKRHNIEFDPADPFVCMGPVTLGRDGALYFMDCGGLLHVASP